MASEASLLTARFDGGVLELAGAGSILINEISNTVKAYIADTVTWGPKLMALWSASMLCPA